jgi:negative regulator of flagellin synthesis FlgM
MAPPAVRQRENTMKITRPLDLVTGDKPAQPAGSDRAGASGKSPAATVTGAPRDRVQLSQLSAQLHALQAELAAGGEFDRARVEAIKQAIREGRLTINAEVIADKMLAAELGLLAPRRS